MGKITVTDWETLDCHELILVSDTFDELKRNLDSSDWCFKRELDLFYLPNNGLWDRDRINIESTECLRQVLNSHCTNDFSGSWYVTRTIKPAKARRQSLIMSAYTKDVPLGDLLLDDCLNAIQKVHCRSLSNSQRRVTSTHHVSQMSTHESGADLEFYSDTLLRDSYTCVFCGMNNLDNLRAVHVLEWHEVDAVNDIAPLAIETWNDIRNGITLCGSCTHLFTEHLVDVSLRLDSENQWHHEIWLSPFLLNNAKWAGWDGTALRLPADEDKLAKWPSRALWMHRLALNTCEDDLVNNRHEELCEAGGKRFGGDSCSCGWLLHMLQGGAAQCMLHIRAVLSVLGRTGGRGRHFLYKVLPVNNDDDDESSDSSDSGNDSD